MEKFHKSRLIVFLLRNILMVLTNKYSFIVEVTLEGCFLFLKISLLKLKRQWGTYIVHVCNVLFKCEEVRVPGC